MILKKLNSRKESGFTLVEFLLASAIFSFFLVLIMVGFLQINRTYNRGVTVKEVQQTARVILEDISRTISTNSEDVSFLTPANSGDPAGFRLCTGGAKYSWNAVNGSDFTTDTYDGPNQDQFVLVKSKKGDSCAEPPRLDDSRALIEGSLDSVLEGGVARTFSQDGNLLIQSLSVTNVPNLDGVYTVDLVISTDDEALTTTGVDAECEFNAGSIAREAAKQYCSVIRVSTAVSARK